MRIRLLAAVGCLALASAAAGMAQGNSGGHGGGPGGGQGAGPPITPPGQMGGGMGTSDLARESPTSAASSGAISLPSSG